MEISKVLFWDTNQKKIDWQKNASFVIQRVVMMGKMKDWQAILAYYGKKKIKTIVVQLRELDDKTHNFLSIYFKIPKEQFRCYTMRQSYPTHYPY